MIAIASTVATALPTRLVRACRYKADSKGRPTNGERDENDGYRDEEGGYSHDQWHRADGRETWILPPPSVPSCNEPQYQRDDRARGRERCQPGEVDAVGLDDLHCAEGAGTENENDQHCTHPPIPATGYGRTPTRCRQPSP